MPYIGNPIYQSAFVTDQFSGDGTTTAFTMSVAPAGVTNVLVVVSGVVQDPSTYGVVGTTLNFSAAPPSGTGNISCRYLGVPVTGVTTTAYRTVTEFTATASQTTFTPPSYNVGFINVYLNGVLLGSADYTSTNGTTVVLATGASAGNILTVESFQISSVANAIPNTAGAVTSSNIQTSVTLTTPTLTSPVITGSTPQATVYTSGSGTYTVPTNARWLWVRMVGGGGGGGGVGLSSGNGGSNGGATTFNSVSANGGGGGAGVTTSNGGAGGNGGSGGSGTATYRSSGAPGMSGPMSVGSNNGGGMGGASQMGGGGIMPNQGTAGAVGGNYGGGGGAAGGVAGSTSSPGGGGGAEYAELVITSLSSTYSYSVGAGGAGGTATGTNAYTGGAGGPGVIYVTAYF